MLQELWEQADDGAEYVFPGRHGVGHRVDLKKPWASLLKAADILAVLLRVVMLADFPLR